MEAALVVLITITVLDLQVCKDVVLKRANRAPVVHKKGNRRKSPMDNVHPNLFVVAPITASTAGCRGYRYMEAATPPLAPRCRSHR